MHGDCNFASHSKDGPCNGDRANLHLRVQLASSAELARERVNAKAREIFGTLIVQRPIYFLKI